MSVASHAFCKTQRDFFLRRKILALFEIGQMGNLVFAKAVPPCQGGVGGQSIFTTVDLRGADDQQFFQFCGNRPGIHHCPQVRDQRTQDLRSMRHRAEHVGYITRSLR